MSWPLALSVVVLCALSLATAQRSRAEPRQPRAQASFTDDKKDCCKLHDQSATGGREFLDCCGGSPQRCPVCVTKAHECCQYWPDNKPTFDQCCMKYGYCPICPSVSDQRACYFNGQWYDVGEVIQAVPEKCYQLECRWHKGWPKPGVYVNHISKDCCCPCCLHKGKVYPNGYILSTGSCTRQQCLGGVWKELAPPAGETKDCPPGSLTWGEDHCLVKCPCAHSWWEAKRCCSRLGGTLVFPKSQKENALLLQKVGNSGGLWLGDDSGSVPRFASTSTSTAARENTAAGKKCLGISGGSTSWNTFFCDNKSPPLKAWCVIDKVGCRQDSCVVNGKVFQNGAVIYQETSKPCHKVICKDGQPKFVSKCCCIHSYFPGIGWVHAQLALGQTHYPWWWLKCSCHKNGSWSCVWWWKKATLTTAL